MMKVSFYDERNNKWHFDCNVAIVEKTEIQFMYDEHIASVEYNNGEYLEIYAVDGVLKGYFEQV